MGGSPAEAIQPAPEDKKSNMSKAEKEAAKAAKKAEKEAAKAVEDSAVLAGDPEGDVQKTKSGIEVGDPMDLRPKKLPLVVKVPENASSAQKEYAKVLNAYAYTNPDKWAKKKAILVKRLEMLADKEVSETNKTISINGSGPSFVFIKDPSGKGEIFAQPEVPNLEE